jgi:hypothetical protein
MPKMYFAEFTDTETGKVFQKFGHTSKNDAMIRLNYITEEHPKFKARVLAAVYHHDINFCKGVEETFKTLYPKNFWLDEKISGITECVILDYDIRNDLIKKIMKLNEKTKKELYESST